MVALSNLGLLEVACELAASRCLRLLVVLSVVYGCCGRLWLLLVACGCLWLLVVAACLALPEEQKRAANSSNNQ